jgi:hypothetical protein
MFKNKIELNNSDFELNIKESQKMVKIQNDDNKSEIVEIHSINDILLKDDKIE